MKYVIIGSNTGGAGAAARLRRLDEQARIVMLEKGGHVSYSNCSLPYRLSGTVDQTEKLVLNTPEALQCRLYWDSARRQALRDYPWAFAQRRAWLARVALPSGFEQEYRFAYALPEACLKAHEVRHEGLLPLPFCLARDPAGDATILLTSASRALLLYTEDVRHCHQFDDLFAHMLARKLACLLAAPLLKSNSQKIAELEQLYSASLPQARQSDASERRPLPLPDSWLQAR